MGNLSEEHVGGAFIYSENPEELASWYKKHLCIDYHLSTIGGETLYLVSKPSIFLSVKTK